MLSHVYNQTLWLISVTAQLLAAMGVGIKWVVMSVRLVAFALLGFMYFIPHLWWYVLSPNIIRRVAYRSSQQTKRRNIEMLFNNVMCTQRRQSSMLNGGDEECGASESRLSFMRSMTGEDPNAVEQLASTLNLADGCVMSALPINEARDDLQEQMGPDSSFNDAMGFIQRYRGRSQSGTNAQCGEVENSANISAQDDHSSSASFEEEDEEDRNNLHNRATLDIYLPIPMDSLFRLMEQEKSMTNRCSLHRKKFPIVISVNGGAWIIGSHFWNFLISRLLSARGYVVFCPDYRNFPQVSMEGMVLDVSDAIQWVLRNAERYNGDLNDVTLLGQSAGAHLTMMSLLSQAQIHAHSAEGGVAPSSVAYNVQRYNPRTSIHRYIGLSGIYNVRGLVKHFHRRGLYRNVLYQITGGRASIARYSLNAYFDQRRSYETGETLPENIFDFFPKRMFFIHGDADNSAPVSESANLAFVMRHAQHARVVEQYTGSGDHARSARVSPVLIEYVVVPGASHTDAIVEEPLCSNASHVVEFLSYYDSEGRRGGKCRAAPPSGRRGSAAFGESASDEDEGPLIPTRNPDWKLHTPAPHCNRPWIIRAASAVCPF